MRHFVPSSRRKFLQASAATLVAAATWTGSSWSVAQEPASTDKKRFRKAVKIGMVNVDGTLEDKFRLLKKLGFDGVELDSPSDLNSDEVLAAIEATGLPVHGVVDSVHWQKTLTHPDEKIREEGLQGLLTALKDAKDFGGTTVLLVPGVCNKDVTYEQAWERSIEQIRKALPKAEELEIDILLENVWNNFLIDPAETARYIDEIDHERIGAYYDVGNSVRYAPPLEWLEKLGKRIRKLDIKEYDLEVGKKDGWGKGFQAELLEGSCGWPEVMAKLKEMDYSGWATAEIPGGDEKRLAEIAERMDRIFSS